MKRNIDMNLGPQSSNKTRFVLLLSRPAMFATGLVFLVVCQGCFVEETLWPGRKIQRTPLDDLERKSFRDIGVTMAFPTPNAFAPLPEIVEENDCVLRLAFHPLKPSKALLQSTVYWTLLDVYLLNRLEFNEHWPFWLFDPNVVALLKKGFDYVGRRNDLKLLEWARQPHPAADLYIRRGYDKEHETTEDYVLLRWVKLNENLYLVCVGTVYPYYLDRKLYVKEDLAGLRTMINSVELGVLPEKPEPGDEPEPLP